MNNQEYKDICPLCGATSKVLKRSPERAFFVCNTCGLAFLNKKNIPKDLDKYYSESYYADTYTGRSDPRVFSYRIKDIKENVKEGGKILEIGSASGEFLKVLEDMGYGVDGVELSSRAGNFAKSKYGLNIYIGDLLSANFPDGSFDAVFMYHVIEHLENPKEVLSEIFRILKSNGVVIIETPNIKSIDCIFSEKLRESIFDVPNHTMLFPPKLLKKVLIESGFVGIKNFTSFSFFISNFLKKKQVKKINDMHISKDLGKIKFSENKEGWCRKVLKRLLPGMKLTVIAKKPN